MILLKEYQEEAYKIVEDKFCSGVNKTTVIWPTGLGKSYIPIKLIEKYSNSRFVVLAPKHNILEQMRGYMEENNIPSDNVMFYTYSGLSRMKEDVMQQISPDYIILDEMHRTGAKEWGNGIDRLWDMYPNAQSLGLTATPIRMDQKDMVLEKFNGDISHQITFEEAIARGLLKMPTKYINAVYSLDGEISDIEKKVNELKDERKRRELTLKLENIKKQLQGSKGLSKIFSKRMSNKEGKYIVFCKDINHMYEMMMKAGEWFRDVNRNIEMYSISSNKSQLENSRILRHFNKRDSKSLKLLFSVDMFNEGIHIKNDGIIMLRPTTSWIIYLQQLGRTLGIQQSGEVFDIVNNSKSREDIHFFYSEIKGIQRRENIEDIDIDFTIYDEVKEISGLLDDIKNYIHFNNLSFEEKVDYLRKLKNQEMQKDDKNYYVSSWISKWRKDYNDGKLSEKQIEEITALGIDLKKQIKNNGEKIEYLRRLKEQGLNLSETKQSDKAEDGSPIGKWISHWRTAYDNKKLSNEEIDAIKDLGIDLEKQKSNSEKRINYLRNLKEQGVDLSQVKQLDESEDGKTIGLWIRNWRKDYKDGNLSEKEIDEINGLGIDLESQKEDTMSTEEKIEYLRKLNNEKADSSEVKQSDKTIDEKTIKLWIKYWRISYKNGKLSEMEIEDITNLGIDLSLKTRQEHKEKAEKKLEQAEKLCEQYENINKKLEI